MSWIRGGGERWVELGEWVFADVLCRRRAERQELNMPVMATFSLRRCLFVHFHSRVSSVEELLKLILFPLSLSRRRRSLPTAQLSVPPPRS